MNVSQKQKCPFCGRWKGTHYPGCIIERDVRTRFANQNEYPDAHIVAETTEEVVEFLNPAN